MEVRLIKTKGRKTITLRVTPVGDIEVRGPRWLTTSYAQQIIGQKSEWIEKSRAKVLARRTSARGFVDGEIFLYLGDKYTLRIVDDYFSNVRVTDGLLEISKFKKNAVKRLLGEWYVKQAHQILPPLLKSRSTELSLKYNRMRITSAKSRWGSCARNGTISFSWKLMQAPLWVIEYVVIHELVHTLHHNHSKEFWRVVETTIPRAREARKVLKSMSTEW